MDITQQFAAMNDTFYPSSHISDLPLTTVGQEEGCSLEAYIRAYKELACRIAELEGQKKQLAQVILQKMQTKTMAVAGYVVRKCERLSVSTDLQKAREWNATKMEEVVDKDKLKQLYQAGHKIPGISISQFVQICNDKKASFSANQSP
jgi:hypothetical protein